MARSRLGSRGRAGAGTDWRSSLGPDVRPLATAGVRPQIGRSPDPDRARVGGVSEPVQDDSKLGLTKH